MYYPDKMQFTTKYSCDIFSLTKVADDTWRCDRGEPHAENARYSSEYIKGMFYTGEWQEISQAEAVEPEMVFPLVYKGKHGGHYKIVQELTGALRWADMESDWVSESTDIYSKDGIAEMIEGGTWIVQSFGEQPKEEPAKVDSLSLTIEVNSKQAVADMQNATLAAIADMQNLAQAVENVTIALQSLQEQLAEMGFGSKVDSGCAAFCCGEG